MKNALDEVKKRYESFDNYFRTCLRLSESELDHIKINLNKKSKLSHYSKSVRDVGLIKRLTAENEKLNAENEKLKKELEEVTKKEIRITISPFTYSGHGVRIQRKTILWRISRSQSL